jgi:UDP-3-O-[3-hydroxymyristoyl] glucosamine N-acyltransferase
MIGGAVGIAGHLEIGDDVAVTGYSLVTHSLPGPGTYSSGLPAIAAADWRRAVARLHRLDTRGRSSPGGKPGSGGQETE